MTGGSAARTYWCERAWLGSGAGVDQGVLVDVEANRIVRVQTSQPAPASATRLSGVVLPGIADAHSHAFHRALRGRASGVSGVAGVARGAGTFWEWRRQMYAVADRLDPDSYFTLARAAYAEMALAGVSAVGEFHYLHHGPRGVAYSDPNAMGHALVAAARAAGLRITLLDACYLAGGIGQPLSGVQERFGDGDAERWAVRAEALAAAYDGAPDVVVGAAVHSVRAVPLDQVPTVAGWAARRSAPLHAHLSEQVAENDACLAAYGRTPAQVLYEAGALGPRTTVVHATHPVDSDVALLGGSTATVCLCPTTERDLADGIGPGRLLLEAGCAVSLGSDSHAVVDPYEEMRAVEMHERLATGRRGHWAADELLAAGTTAGHGCLGRPDAGVIAPGARADLVAVRTDSVRTAGAGSGADAVVFAATAADVTDVVVDGRAVVVGGMHQLEEALGRDVGTGLALAVVPLWEARP
ncbi:MAG: N-formimino-L-glutamate deiminase [Nocardioidaceae bacterium]|nr:N-formimino-L-glutamate deiminase [Nocardioidaceae bacterium]